MLDNFECLSENDVKEVSGGNFLYISYTVKQGETIETIAADFGTTVDFLAGINRLPARNADVKPGEKILVPTVCR